MSRKGGVATGAKEAETGKISKAKKVASDRCGAATMHAHTEVMGLLETLAAHDTVCIGGFGDQAKACLRHSGGGASVVDGGGDDGSNGVQKMGHKPAQGAHR